MRTALATTSQASAVLRMGEADYREPVPGVSLPLSHTLRPGKGEQGYLQWVPDLGQGSPQGQAGTDRLVEAIQILAEGGQHLF